MNKSIKKYLFPSLITVAVAFIYYYLALPAMNIRSGEFWCMLLVLSITFIVSYLGIGNPDAFKRFSKWLSEAGAASNQKNKKSKKSKNDYVVGGSAPMPKWLKVFVIVLVGVIALVAILCFVTSSKVFRAKDYQQMLTVTESDFAKDISELDTSQIPTVDKDTAERLGSRKIGEVVELVSQFNVAGYYSQINYKNKPFRVTPLEYDGFLKWLSNRSEGIPYYVSIDMANPDEGTQLVKLSEGMKYSPSEYFARDLKRHIRLAYPTKMFENLSFEVDDNGTPYWVMSYYTYTFGIVGGKDIAGIILVNAVTGEMVDYPIAEVPQWVDIAYSAELLVEQADNWGSLKNGFINSIFVQKNVVVTTDGYNYIAVNDDIWLYTGITSVVADESNIGFILINLRTKEAKTYMINGAEEYSAMGSAEGQIQEKGYIATFPILLNVAEKPSYFISLKDNVGLVKAYAFVSVENYQIVGVADTIDGAKAEYLRMLNIEVPETGDDAETVSVSGIVENIATTVVNGNSVYYIMISGVVYKADISVSDLLPFIKTGDSVTLVTADNVVKSVYLTSP